MTKALERINRAMTVKPKDLLKPFDVTKLGSKEDPCFGKLYSLTASECQMCGDIELCAIKFASKQNKVRKTIEKTTRFKDLEEVDLLKNKEILTFYYKATERLTPTRAKILTTKKFNITKNKLTEILY